MNAADTELLAILIHPESSHTMEEPSTLAEALLDDLDDLSDNGSDDSELERVAVVDGVGHDDQAVMANDQPKPSFNGSFLQDSQLQNHMELVRGSSPASRGSTGKEADAEEYRLVVQSNKQLARLGDELLRAHGQLCLAYKPKFPELEEILPNPIQYKNAVKVIRNETDISLVNDALNRFLSPNQVLTVSVSGSTTSGRPLDNDQLATLDQAIQYMEDILALQDELSTNVERRMENMAPNVSAILGPRVTAQLLGLSGGLEELSKIPACNLQVIGQTRQTSASRGGMSSVHTRPNEGILRECSLVQQCPKNFQIKALKTVAAKVALAARCDFVSISAGRARDDSAGRAFYLELERRINKFGESDKAPVLKALPK